MFNVSNCFAKLIYFFALSIVCFCNVSDATDASADVLLCDNTTSEGIFADKEPVVANATIRMKATLCKEGISEAIDAFLAEVLQSEVLFPGSYHCDSLLSQWRRMMNNASRYYRFHFYEDFPRNECIVKRSHDNNKEEKNMRCFFDMPHSHGIGVMILMALLGGLLLNFMPCSIPALCFKARSKDKVMYLAGVGCVFFIIASVFAILKLAGHMLCWGMHMQNVWFLFGLYLITLIFFLHALRGSALHLFFSFQSKISTFIYGMICATLSLSCVAPFMGGACAFALSRGIFEIYLVMFCLFLGFISPYLGLFSRFSLLSKINAKCVESFFQASMLVLVLWFFSLLSSHLSLEHSVAIGMLSLLMLSLQILSNRVFMMIVIAGAMLFVMHQHAVSEVLHGRRGHVMHITRTVARPSSFHGRPEREVRSPEHIVFNAKISPRSSRDTAEYGHLESNTKSPEHIVFNAKISPRSSRDAEEHGHPWSDTISAKIQWHSFSTQLLNSAIAQNKIVMVYFTSDWCLTCQYLKQSVFERKAVIRKCLQFDVVCLMADLTKSNPEALAFLQKHNQYGIPCTMLFYKNGSYIMPEVYTASSLLRAIDMMSK